MDEIEFTGKVLAIGCGAVGSCTYPLMLKLLKIKPKNLRIFDKIDKSEELENLINLGVKFKKKKIKSENFLKIFKKYLKKGDLLIDLAYNLDTISIIEWCHENEVLFVNTSIEVWFPEKNIENKNPQELTLYHRHLKIKNLIKKRKKRGPTQILEIGQNPGAISLYVQKGLIDIAKYLIDEIDDENKIEELKKSINEKHFAKIAYLVGLKVIHVSERDTQISKNPKKTNEFAGTWSIDGLIEEGIAPCEIAININDPTPENAFVFEQNSPMICFPQKGIDVKVRSWTPLGQIHGFVIRHGETITISEKLTLWKDEKPIYRPSCYYAYCPCDATIASLHEFKMRDFEIQEEKKILGKDIVSGKDAVGALLMCEDITWWTGSVLSIEQTRKLVETKSNATELQVAITIIAGIKYLIENPNQGLLYPDDLDYKYILDFCIPYFGDFLSEKVKDWNHYESKNEYLSFGRIKREKDFQFKSFLVETNIYSKI